MPWCRWWAGALLFGIAAIAWGLDAPEEVWTYRGPLGFVDSSPAVADLDGDGQPEWIVTTTAGSTIALESNGRQRWMHNVQIPITVPPTVANIRGDELPEVLVVNQAGQIFCLDGRSGEVIWRRALPGGIAWGATALVAADLEGRGKMSVIAADDAGIVLCLSPDGDERWRHEGDHGSAACPAVGDVTGGPELEVLIAGTARALVCLGNDGKVLWELDRDGPGASPVLADLTGNGRMEILAASGAELMALDGDGTIRWSYTMSHEVDAGITVADTGPGGALEIYAVDLGGRVVSLDANGRECWRHELLDRVRRPPAIVDVNGDGQREVLVAGYTGHIALFRTTGEHLGAVRLGGHTNAIPTAMAMPGATPIVAVPKAEGVMSVYQWAGESPGSTHPVAQYRFDAARTGAFRPAAPDTGIALVAVDYGKFHAGGNSFAVTVDNPNALPVTLALTVERGDLAPITRQFVGDDKTISGQLAYTVPDAAPAAFVFIIEVKHGDAIAVRRSHEAFVQPFAREWADLRAGIDALEMACAGVDGADAFLGVLYRIQRDAPAWEASVAIAGTMDDRARRTLRDELHRAIAELEAPIPLLSIAAAHEDSLLVTPANPWAPFGGFDEVSEGRVHNGAISVEGFHGELESAALNLFNLSGRTLTLQVSLDDFTGVNGGPVSWHEVVELCEVVTVPTQTAAMAPDALPRLNNGNLIVVPPWEARQLWLSADLSALDTGEWESRLTLRSLEVEPVEQSAAIRVTVWPHALPDDQPASMCLWGYVERSHFSDFIEESVADMAAHGSNVFSISTVPRATYDDSGALTGPIDFTAHDEFVARYSPHGIMLFQHTGALSGPGPMDGEAYRTAHIAFLHAWVEHLKVLGLTYDDWALYPVDEPGLQAGLVERFLFFARLAREADPNIRIYANPVARITTEELESMVPFVDIWAPHRVGFLLDTGLDRLELMHATGATMWTYECEGDAKRQSPLGYYRGLAWLSWHRSLTGWGFWTYCTSQHDPWFVPSGSLDYLLTYPGRGPVSSKRWEAVRDGIEDYGMLWRLLQATESARARAAHREAVQAAEDFLAQGVRSIAAMNGLDGELTVPTGDGGAVDRRRADARWAMLQEARRELAALLTQLEAE